MKTIEYCLPELEGAAQKLLQELAECSTICLIGSLGAGKTTLCAAMFKQLGVSEAVISPTFTYFNQYQAQDGRMIYHFDLYRLKNVQEFEAAGFFEYLDQPNSLVFIEWPEIVESALTGKIAKLYLKSMGEDKRNIEYEIKNQGAVV